MREAEPQIMDNVADLLKQMIGGYRLSQMIYVAAKLLIADHLAAGPKTADELAVATSADRESLGRVLRALASFGVFSEGLDGRFRLNPLAARLQKGTPGSLWACAASIGEPWWWRPWGQLLHTVQSGQVAFDHVYGEGIFQYLRTNDQASALFNENMRATTEFDARHIVAAYDFSQSDVIADIGGGTGALLFAVLRSHPGVRGILFDDPAVIAETRAHRYDSKIGGRCSFVSGNFFTSIPVSADLYLLKDVLHDWDDKRAISILHQLRMTMPFGSKLLLIERLLTVNERSSTSKELDIVMLVLTGGKERSEEQYRDLLASAGFTLTQVVTTSLGIGVMEATPS